MFGNLGRALTRIREHRGISQTAIAGSSGIGKSQLSKYERGKELPKLDSLQRVLDSLGVSYIDFSVIVATLDHGAPAMPEQDVDPIFSRLTLNLFTLHRQVVQELRHD